MKSLSRFLGLAVALFAANALADTTGLWSDPAEPGWGLTLAEQGGSTFATLLVYDQDRKPTWFVASSLTLIGTDTGAPGGAPIGLSGALYRTAGSGFGMPFDPSALHVDSVGLLQVLFVDRSVQPESLHVTYSVDGRVIDKTVRRQTWASNINKLVGAATYEGGLYVTASQSATGAGCPPVFFAPAQGRPFVFQVSGAEQGSRVRIAWGTGIDTACTIDGNYEQRGEFGAVTGPLLCGPIGGATLVFVAQLEGLQVNDHGFAGAATVTRDACTYSGHIGGVKQGT
jgi:hypothetical protein